MADHIVEYLKDGRIEKFADLMEKYSERITKIISWRFGAEDYQKGSPWSRASQTSEI